MSIPESRRPISRVLRRAAAVALVRARMLVAVGGLVGVLAAWPYLRIAFDKLTTVAPTGQAVSGDTEYWCPMCPGVLSDWPSKCPVCSMGLVRRQKGDMTPLPDGVVARVQLSPYRIQLAGLRTSPVEYRRLEWTIVVGGLLEGGTAEKPAVFLTSEVFEPEASALSVGLVADVTCDPTPAEPAKGEIVDLAPPTAATGARRVRIRIETKLRPGAYASAKFVRPASSLPEARRAEQSRWSLEAATAAPMGEAASTEALLRAGIRQAFAAKGLTLCVPEPAVIDTGDRTLVYVETMPGMFDAIEVKLGRRILDFHPVIAGLDVGQRVVAVGAVLLDAETRLNPNVAAGYFGAGSLPLSAHPVPPPKPTGESEQQLIAHQKICPVTGEPLGSMGDPYRVGYAARPVFVCCKGCEKPFLKKPDSYLAKLPK